MTIAGFAIMLGLLGQSPPAPPTCFPSDEAFHEWSHLYYQHPDPAKIVCAVFHYARSQMFQDRQGRMPQAYFFAAALRDHPGLVDALFESLGSTDARDAQAFGLNVLWILDTERSRDLISKAMREWGAGAPLDVAERILAAPRPEDLPNSPITRAGQIDDLWAAYEATGSKDLIRKVISIVHLREEGSGMDIVLGAAASWSLQSFAQEDARVRDVIREASGSATGATKSALEEILGNTAPEGGGGRR